MKKEEENFSLQTIKAVLSFDNFGNKQKCTTLMPRERARLIAYLISQEMLLNKQFSKLAYAIALKASR